MEKEEFAFSPLQPILFVMASPAFYYWFSNEIDVYLTTHSVIVFLIVAGLTFLALRQLRLTLLMLLLRPAVILTDEFNSITESFDKIYWKDVSDVYMASSGGGAMRAPVTSYVIIKVRQPEAHLRAIKNPVSRNYRWYTRNWRPSPFEVNLFLVKGDDDEIYHTILRFYQNNRGI